MRRAHPRIALLVPVGLGIAVVAPFCFHVVNETDAGWHLAVGRVIARSGIPFRNTLCWTAPDEPWYATSWLFDLVSYWLVEALGLAGIQAFMFGCVALTLVGAAAVGRRLDAAAGAWCAPALGLLLIPKIAERPYVASWAVLAWVFWLCLPEPAERASTLPEKWDRSFRRRLWCIPIIAFQSNIHSGAVFPSILLALFCAEGLVRSGRWVREAALAAAGFVALLANPGGVFNVLYILEHLRVHDLINVAELETPSLRRGQVFYGSIPVALALASRERRRTAVPLAAVAGFGVFAVRLVYDYYVVMAPVIALAFEPVRRWRGERAVGLAVAGVLGLLVIERWTWTELLDMGPRWDSATQPVRAGDFIRAEHLDGRMYNGFEEGGYLEWALPELQWFQDARIQAFPPAFFRNSLAVDDSPAGFREWLVREGVEWAVVTRLPRRRMAGRQKLYSPGWALVYWDDASEVFVRRDVARFAGLVSHLEYRYFHPWGARTAEVAAASRQELREWEKEVGRFEQTSPDNAFAKLVRCEIATRLGEPTGACERSASLDQSPEWLQRVEQAKAMAVAQ